MAAPSRPDRFLAAARADLRHGAVWYEERREGLGEAFTAHVRRAIEMIARAPERWPMRRGMRRYVLRRFPYTIAYRLPLARS